MIPNSLAALAPAIGNHLWQTTAFATAIWLATLALRKNQAGVRHALWLAASLKFLLPFSLLIALGTLLPKPHQPPAAPEMISAVDFAGEPFSEITPQPAPTHPQVTPTLRERTLTELPLILTALWLSGVALVLAIWAIRYRRILTIQRRALPADTGREIQILRNLESSLNTRHPTPLLLSPDLLEPGILGIFRLRILWPAQLSARLDDAHIEAILAHELLHDRRRDNLTAALHMLVEALFWFHPAVWFLERRLIDERERACDEAVVHLGTTPETYAEGLLKAVRFCLESPLPCVAGISGANLNQRIVGIMTLRLRRLSLLGKLALTGFAALAIAAPLAFGIIRIPLTFGQILRATGPLPSFEVATIRPWKPAAPPPPPNEPIIQQQTIRLVSPGKPNGGGQTTDRVHLIGETSILIALAYNLPIGTEGHRIVDAPSWVTSQDNRYEVTAKIDEAHFAAMKTMTPDQQHEQVCLMEQSLLADRFHLKAHIEARPMPGYTLVEAKGGHKLTPSKEGEHNQLTAVKKDGVMEMTATAVPISMFAKSPMINGAAGGWAGVIDQTGLKGTYDFTLRWSLPQPAPADNGAPPPDAPGLLTAVQEQLGLRLVPAKVPTEVIVIDHIEPPADQQQSQLAAPPPPQPTQSKPLTQLLQLASFSPAPKAAPPTDLPTAAYIPTMTFEVASVRQSQRDGNSFSVRGGFEPNTGCHLTIENFNLDNLLRLAYAFNLEPTGVPKASWWNTYNVQAHCSEADEARLATLPKEQRLLEQLHMVQLLLADRFALKVHFESPDGPTYDLVVSKPGRIASTGAPPSAEELKGFGDRPIPPLYQRGSSKSGFEFIAHGATMDILAHMLTVQFGRPVNDKTGLTGKYDFDLKYHGTRTDDRRDDETNPWPPLENAIQDQLGLKLVATHAPVPTLIVDHLEPLSEN